MILPSQVPRPVRELVRSEQETAKGEKGPVRALRALRARTEPKETPAV